MRQEEVAKMGHGVAVAEQDAPAVGARAAVVAERVATAVIEPTECPVAETRVVDGSPVSAPMPASPFPAASAVALGFAETATEGALAKIPETAPAGGGPSAEALRLGVVAALANGEHASASQLLGSGNWILDVASLRIEVAGVGKKMLSLTVNAAAEKIIRQELARLGGPARFMVVPGEGGGRGAGPAMSAPVAGSIQEEALSNPLVQRAKEIFNAEVRSVVDLRGK